MGTWDNTPWDNDDAADWFDSLFEEINLREKVRECLEMDMDRYYKEIRAAAYMLIFLGKSFIWPVDERSKDLSLAIKKMEELQQHPYYNLPNDFGNDLKYETAILKYYLNEDNKLPATPDFVNWWLSLLRESAPFDSHQTGDFLDCFTKKVRIKDF